MRWLKDHIIELAALVVTCSAGIASFASGIAGAFRAEPLALIVWSLFMIAIGLCVGWCVRGAAILLQSAGLGALSGKRAERYVENQPEAYKAILRDALDNDGVLYDDSLDSDMQNLAARGFFEVPSARLLGFECAWALTPKAVELLKSHPECLNAGKDNGNE